MAGPAKPTTSPGLIADIGGTNARFALLIGGRVSAIEVLRTADHADIGSAVAAYLDRAAPAAALGAAAPGAAALGAAAFAVAAPVTGDLIELTNRDWSFSVQALKQALGLGALHVVNDFAAVALAVPRLAPGEVEPIGGGTAVAGRPIAVIGPGTGLGVSALVGGDGEAAPVSTEGGHVTLAAADAREDAVIAHLRARFGHVSAERCLSGPGLVNLYCALAALDGGEAAELSPADITDRALAGADTLCVEAVGMFSAMLGTVAGNLALSLGARGGVYIAGGIVPQLGALFAASEFRARFEAKGRFAGYMAAIPTFVITADTPAFTGLAALLED